MLNHHLWCTWELSFFGALSFTVSMYEAVFDLSWVGWSSLILTVARKYTQPAGWFETNEAHAKQLDHQLSSPSRVTPDETLETKKGAKR